MLKSDALELVALIDRLWFGARLAEAMTADPQMFAEWYEILRHADAVSAREAVQALNAEPDRFPPRPGQIARRASEIAASNIVALPDPELTRAATPEELAVARRLPELRRRIAALGAAKDPNR